MIVGQLKVLGTTWQLVPGSLTEARAAVAGVIAESRPPSPPADLFAGKTRDCGKCNAACLETSARTSPRTAHNRRVGTNCARG